MRQCRHFIVTTLSFAASLASFAALSHDYKIGLITLVHPWTRATPPGAKVGGAYVTIVNQGAQGDRLVGGSSPVAGRIEIHRMETEGGIMRMHPLADGLEIAPGAKVEIKPGSFHLMLLDLKSPLREGERVPLSLEFARAGRVAVELAVGSVGAKDAGQEDRHDASHGSARP